MGKLSSSIEPRKSRFVYLISVFGMLSTLLLYIPIKLGIIGNRIAAYAQQQQTGIAAADPLSSSFQIAQSKVQAATSPGAWGHGVPSLHNISSQDLLMILETTSGCIIPYLIIRTMLHRAKEKEEGNETVMYQQQ